MARIGIGFVGTLFTFGAAASGASAQQISLGETAPPSSDIEYVIQTTAYQTATAASSPSYEVPSGDWVITCWSTQAAIDEDGSVHDGNARLRVIRPDEKSGQQLRVQAQSAERTLPPSAGEAVSFATNIAVQGGDLLGLRAGTRGGAPLLYDSEQPGDLAGFVFGDPDVGQGFNPSSSPRLRVNVAATLQPAGMPLPGSCEDAVRPRINVRDIQDAIRRGTVRIRFGTKEPANYLVKLDGKKLEDTTPPVRLHGLDFGRHVVTILATDSAGNVARETVEFRRVKGRATG